MEHFVDARLDSCCVYVLMRGEEVVFASKSVNISSRYRGHRRAGLAFDRCLVRWCAREEMDLLEHGLIVEHRPVLNRSRVVPEGLEEVKVDLAALGLARPEWRRL